MTGPVPWHRPHRPDLGPGGTRRRPGRPGRTVWHPRRMTTSPVHTPQGGVDAAAADLTAEDRTVVDQVCSATGVVWVRPPDDARHHMAWQVWHDGAVHVVSGHGEQQLPRLEGPVELVVPHKGTHTRALTLAATATTVQPGTDAWSAAADALAPKRLNAVETHAEAGAQRERWATACVITRIDPVRVLGKGPAARGEAVAAGSEAPRPVGATTAVFRPWHLRGRAGRRG